MKLSFLLLSFFLSSSLLSGQTQLTTYSDNSSNSGLPLIRKLVALDDGILMIGDGMIYYKDGEVTPVTSSRIYHYSGDGSVIYFGDPILGGLYSYDGNELLLVSEEDVRGVKLSEGMTYFYSSYNGDLYAYDRTTFTLAHIRDLSHFRDWEIFNDDLYFIDERSLYHHSYHSPLKLVADSMIFQYSTPFHRGLDVVDGHLCFSRESGHYRINSNDETEKIASISDLEIPFVESHISNSGMHLLCSGESFAYHFDGHSFQKIDDGRIILPNFLSVGAEHFVSLRLVSKDGDFIYDSEDRSLAELPSSSVVGVFDYQDEVKVVGVNYSDPDRNLNVFRADSNYDLMNVEKSLNYNSLLFSHFDALISGDKGIIMLSPYLTYISSGNYRVDESLSIDSRFENLLQIGDQIYFIADDGVSGRQLYSYYMKSVATDDLQIVDASIKIAPNPAIDIINVVDHTFRAIWEKYRMLTTDGKPVKQGRFSSQISVSNLNPGAYILELKSGRKVCYKSFIKI